MMTDPALRAATEALIAVGAVRAYPDRSPAETVARAVLRALAADPDVREAVADALRSVGHTGGYVPFSGVGAVLLADAVLRVIGGSDE